MATSATPSPPPVPGRFDRAALERILQRAAELQAAERDIGEGLTAEEIVALGQEVGIPAHLLRQAMLEEGTRGVSPRAEGWLDRMIGPTEVVVSRVIRGDMEGIERALLEHMEQNEALAVQRRQPGRITWEKLASLHAALRQALSVLDASRVRFLLRRTDLVSAVTVPLEPGWCHVTLTASLAEARREVTWGAAFLGGLGLAGSAVLLVLNAVAPVALAPIVGGGFLAWVSTRPFRPLVNRVLLGLERALDHAEGEGIKPGHELPPRPRGWLGLLVGEWSKLGGGKR
jgi:hypothetical protein